MDIFESKSVILSLFQEVCLNQYCNALSRNPSRLSMLIAFQTLNAPRDVFGHLTFDLHYGVPFSSLGSYWRCLKLLEMSTKTVHILGIVFYGSINLLSIAILAWPALTRKVALLDAQPTTKTQSLTLLCRHRHHSSPNSVLYASFFGWWFESWFWRIIHDANLSSQKEAGPL